MKYLVMEKSSTEEIGEAAVPSLSASGRRRRKRRRWTVEQKLSIVREAQDSGDPVAVVAQRHDMNANYLFSLMRQVRDGKLGDRSNPLPTLTPPTDFIELGVVVRDVEPKGSAPARLNCEVAVEPGQASPADRMEIVGANGRRVIVDCNVDVEALLRIMRGLETLR